MKNTNLFVCMNSSKVAWWQMATPSRRRWCSRDGSDDDDDGHYNGGTIDAQIEWLQVSGV